MTELVNHESNVCRIFYKPQDKQCLALLVIKLKNFVFTETSRFDQLEVISTITCSLK